MIAMMVEVLPAPLGTSRLSTVPADTPMLRPSTALTKPYPQLRFSSRNMRMPLAEIGPAHVRGRHDVVRCAISDDAALIEDNEAAAHTHDFREIVLDEHRRDAHGIDRRDDVRL